MNETLTKNIYYLRLIQAGAYCFISASSSTILLFQTLHRGC